MKIKQKYWYKIDINDVCLWYILINAITYIQSLKYQKYAFNKDKLSIEATKLTKRNNQPKDGSDKERKFAL